VIEYQVICDGCGAFIASSRMSARAPRAADAALNASANHGPDGDHCRACRVARSTLSAEDRERAAKAAHSVGQRR
jgi:hypothetical protein